MHLTHAQSYQSGHASSEVDSLYIILEEHLVMGQSEAAKQQLQSLINYWSEPNDSIDPGVRLHNQYYALLKKHWLNVLTNDTEEDFLFALNLLIKEVTKDLGIHHELTGFSYLLKGKYQENILKNNQLAYKTYEHTLDLLQETVEFPKAVYQRSLAALAYNLNKQKKTVEGIQRLKDYHQDETIEKDSLQILKSQYTLGFLYYSISQLDSAQIAFNTSYRIAKKELPQYHRIRINVARNLGILYKYFGNYDKALTLQLESLELLKTKYGVIDSIPLVEIHYESISDVYRRNENFPMANNYIDSAIYYANHLNRHQRLHAFLLSKGNVAASYDEKILLIKEALAICEENSLVDDKAEIYHNLGEVYRVKRQYSTALDYLLKAKALKETRGNDDINLHSSYTSIASVYSSLGNIEEAILMQKKAVELTQKHFTSSSIEYPSSIGFLGKLLSDNGHTAEAKILLNESLTLFDSLQTSQSHSYYTNNLIYLSEVYQKDSLYDDALKLSQAAYRQSVKRVSDRKYRTNYYIYHLASAYIDVGELDSAGFYMDKLLEENSLSLDMESHSKTEELDIAFSFDAFLYYLDYIEKINHDTQDQLFRNVTIGLDLVNRIYTGFIFESEAFHLQTRARKFIDWSLRNLFAQRVSLASDQYYNLIYQCIELDKNIRLQNVMPQNYFTSNLNYARIETERKELKQEYVIFRNKLSNLNPRDSLYSVYSDKLFSLQLVKDSLIDIVQAKYPDYYQRRFDRSIMDFEACQSAIADENTALIFHYENEDSIYQLIISDGFRSFDKLNADSLNYHLENLQQSIMNTSESGFDQSKSAFVYSSHSLFDQLLKGAQDSLPFHLIFLPDGELSYLSFDLLLTDVNLASYKQLPYLLKKHSISYLSSATQLRDGTRSRDHDMSYVGFAPSYEAGSESKNSYRGNLQQLFYNQDEVLQAAHLFDGKHYMANQATESNFKSAKGKSSILHLAMHTTIDDQDPLGSYLNFNIDSTGTEDGKLYLTEIARMNINSDLVILSACETNKGKQIKGQGLMGIARAFMQANSHNLLFTNWVVDDKSSHMIVRSFLALFKEHVPAHLALRRAKLDYLEQCSTMKSSPLYWSGYNFYGTSFERQNNSHLLYLAYALGLIALFCCIAVLKNKL